MYTHKYILNLFTQLNRVKNNQKVYHSAFVLGVLGEPATLPVSRIHEKRAFPSLTHMPAAAPMSGLWQGSGDLGHVGSIINRNHSGKRCFQPLRIKSDVVSVILANVSLLANERDKKQITLLANAPNPEDHWPTFVCT